MLVEVNKSQFFDKLNWKYLNPNVTVVQFQSFLINPKAKNLPKTVGLTR